MAKIISINRETLGEMLKQARESVGVSMAGLAEQTGIAASHIWSIEGGSKELSFEKLFAISHSLGICFDTLVAHATEVDRTALFQIALAEVAGIKTSLFSDEKVRISFAAYAADCSSVAIYHLLYPGTSGGLRFEYPSPDIERAILAVGGCALAISHSTRREWISKLCEKPYNSLTELGLTTPKLITDFLEFSKSKEKGGPLNRWTTYPEPLKFHKSNADQPLPSLLQVFMFSTELEEFIAEDKHKLVMKAIKKMPTKRAGK